MADAMKNNAWATILTAPSPAVSGTTIVVNSAQGTKLPAAPFNAKVVPAGTMNPYMSDGEIIRVTAISTDTLTVTRAQESSSALSIAVGDVIMAMPTKKTFDDLNTAIDASVQPTSTTTLTNKRITKRITTITSSATPTVNTDNCDAVTITALATAITSMTSGLTGTPSNFDSLVYRIKDDGTARVIAWGASFVARGATPPTTTVLGKITTVGFFYNSVTSTWDCVACVTEA